MVASSFSTSESFIMLTIGDMPFIRFQPFNDIAYPKFYFLLLYNHGNQYMFFFFENCFTTSCWFEISDGIVIPNTKFSTIPGNHSNSFIIAHTLYGPKMLKTAGVRVYDKQNSLW